MNSVDRALEVFRNNPTDANREALMWAMGGHNDTVLRRDAAENVRKNMEV
jgi:hypothetical protein